jgi:FkbH-like protein
MNQTIAAEGFSAVVAAVASQESAAQSFKDEVKVLVLRQITVEGLDVFLKHHLFARGVRAVVEFGGYGTQVSDVLAADGVVARLQPQVVVLALALDELDPQYGLPGWRADTALNEVLSLLDLLLAKTQATVVVHNFLPPLWNEQGLVQDAQGHDMASQVAALNQQLVATVRQHAPRLVLADWESALRRLGAAAALDERGRYLWSAPFRHAFLDTWAQQLARVCCALKGRAKKVLVLDCDNTLWGGVVGEDGLDGIALDASQYPGRAFCDFQATVLHLAERGVLLTLCSKNNEADVFEVLDKHPAMRLKRKHLAGWRVNWQDKASNIAALAEELNLGLDAFVFVDDSPLECGLVREMLPQVTVLQVPKKLHELPPMLLQQGLFDTLHVTDEDRKRAQLYQSESQRKTVRGAFGNLEEYLQSLQTVASIHRATPAELPRVAQLTQKTNQFNLTTRRYSEGDLQAFVHSAQAAVYTLSVRDRFGSLGLVGAMVVKLQDNSARVDTFLMSCRALGRRLEAAMVRHCIMDVNRLAASSSALPMDWHAEFIPTAKNAQVADFWPQMGFAELAAPPGGAAGHRHYRLRAGDSVAGTPTHVTIEEQ